MVEEKIYLSHYSELLGWKEMIIAPKEGTQREGNIMKIQEISKQKKEEQDEQEIVRIIYRPAHWLRRRIRRD